MHFAWIKFREQVKKIHLNPFLIIFLIIDLLKTRENQKSSDVLGGIKWEHWLDMG